MLGKTGHIRKDCRNQKRSGMHRRWIQQDAQGQTDAETLPVWDSEKLQKSQDQPLSKKIREMPEDCRNERSCCQQLILFFRKQEKTEQHRKQRQHCRGRNAGIFEKAFKRFLIAADAE